MIRARIVLALLIAVSACGPTHRPTKEHIVFLGAASTHDAIVELRDSFQTETGHRVELTFGGSSRLAVQIQNGFEADLFLPANQAWADEVAVTRDGRARVLDRTALLSNRLVVIAPVAVSRQLESLADLLDLKGDIAIAEPTTVPAGIYTKQALVEIDLWHHLHPRLVPAANVRAALRYVETGAAVVGFVYASDTVANHKVEVVAEVDPSLHDEIVYPLLLLRHSQNHPGARMFFDFLQSDRARTVFEHYSFERRGLDAPAS